MKRLLLLAALTSGLASAQTLTSPPVNGMVWELQRLVDDGRTTTFPASPSNPSLSFDGKRSAGNAGCNTYRAPYASRQDLLRFGQVSTTRMACAAPRMALETQFLRLLKGVGRYTVERNVLTLYSGSGDLLVFRQRSGAKPAQPVTGSGQPGAGQPGLNGVSWTLVMLNGQVVQTNRAISFKLDGARLGGSDGCNSFGGEGQTDNRTFRATGPLIGTQMACLSGDRVPSLPALLQRGASYTISGGSLILTGDGNTWVFNAGQDQATPSPAAA